MRGVARWIVVSLVLNSSVWAQAPVVLEPVKPVEPVEEPVVVSEYQPSHPKLAVAGVVIAALGIGLVSPGGDVKWFGETYCVMERSVDYGSCTSHQAKQIGLAMIGAGALMTWIGARSKRVTVSPQLSKTTKGASATIRWGAR